LENFGDGTLSALWTFSNQATAYSDRGMAYQQFDGTAWTKLPDYNDAANIFRIEDARTGFGSLARVSNVGDIVVSHQTAIDALQINRNTSIDPAGENWISAANTDMPLVWPRMRTGGPDGKTVHIIGVTPPTGLGGTVYNPLNDQRHATWENGAMIDISSTIGVENTFLINIHSHTWVEGDRFLNPSKATSIQPYKSGGQTLILKGVPR
jgi:hypothetical protein